MDQDKTERQGMKRGETARVGDEEALVLEKEHKGKRISMHVATDGEPYILKTATEGSASSSMTFDNYGETVKVQQPPQGEIVDPKGTQA